MKNIVAGQVLAALMSAPSDHARKALTRLEPNDFDNWQYRVIFEALSTVTYANHPEPGSIIIQVNAHLLEAGHYADQDNGLRKTVADLAGIVGHPEQLAAFIHELLHLRFRREVADFALSITEHAQSSPLADVDAALRGIEELRRLRTRINTTEDRTLKAVREGSAA